MCAIVVGLGGRRRLQSSRQDYGQYQHGEHSSATMYLLSRPGPPVVAAGWRLGLWVFPVVMDFSCSVVSCPLAYWEEDGQRPGRPAGLRAGLPLRAGCVWVAAPGQGVVFPGPLKETRKNLFISGFYNINNINIHSFWCVIQVSNDNFRRDF